MNHERPFKREEDFVLFNQYGVKLNFSNTTPNADYYDWLDDMIHGIGQMVPGSRIIEKADARADPRRNTGVYYDTADYRLLANNMVLRTTCNPKTHAFCAFKLGEDEEHIRRDHRHIFEGADKHLIQTAPTSPEAEATVKRLLNRTDIVHPGVFLKRWTGISSSDLSQSLCLDQYRRTFYVLLDGSDALRCSLDRVDVSNLRLALPLRYNLHFSEVEIPIYPRISPAITKDPRLPQLINALSESLQARFPAPFVEDSKYRRAAQAAGIPIPDQASS